MKKPTPGSVGRPLPDGTHMAQQRWEGSDSGGSLSDQLWRFWVDCRVLTDVGPCWPLAKKREKFVVSPRGGTNFVVLPVKTTFCANVGTHMAQPQA